MSAQGRSRVLQTTSVVAAFAVIGLSLVTLSRAAVFDASAEAESGKLAGNASAVNGAGASGNSNNSVRFGTGSGQPVSGYQTFELPFTADSPLNRPIPANPQLDPNSAALVTANFKGSVSFLNSYEGGHTIYKSSAADPLYTVQLKGNDGFAKTVNAKAGSGACNPLHIPSDATIPGQHDRWMMVVDTTKPGLICEIWLTAKSGNTWSGTDGDVYDLNGDGIKPLAGYGTGSGLPASGLMIRVGEVKAGVIRHPLVFPPYCNHPTKFRWPASKTDGNCSASQPLEEGMLFQLDPAFNCMSVPAGLERMVCVALQQYGAYDGDVSGQTQQLTTYTGFMMETDDPSDPARQPPNKPGDYNRPGGLYCLLGACQDFYHLDHIPLDRLRILKPLNQQ